MRLFKLYLSCSLLEKKSSLVTKFVNVYNQFRFLDLISLLCPVQPGLQVLYLCSSSIAPPIALPVSRGSFCLDAMPYHSSMLHGKFHLLKPRFLWNQSKPLPICQGLLCPALCTLPGVGWALKLGPHLKEWRWDCVAESSYVYRSRNRLRSFEHRTFILFPQEPFVVNFTLKFQLRTLEMRE